MGRGTKINLEILNGRSGANTNRSMLSFSTPTLYAEEEEEKRRKKYAQKVNLSILQNDYNSSKRSSNPSSSQTKEKNSSFLEGVGNFFEGVGYLGHKLGLGFLDSVEGTVDYLSSTFAKMFGNDDAAERILGNDWVNYNAADDWFEPNEGWKTAGDIAGGVGNAAYTIVLGIPTSGFGAVIGGATSGAGNAAQEAYRDSGEYGWDELGYASVIGAIEGGLEAVIGKAGKWSKSIASSLGLSIGKSATSKVAATTAKSVAKKAINEFASEGFEEMITEFVTPYVKRATYDPNAKNATADEILYAGLVGGLTGVITGGGVGAVNQLTNLRTGKKIADSGNGTKVLTLAEELMNIGGKNNYTDAIKTVYDKVSPAVKSGAVLNVSQKRALGELQRLETGAVFEPIVKRSAISVVHSADAVASRLNSEGVYKIVDGKMTNVKDPSFDAKDAEVRDITAEDITRGVVFENEKRLDTQSVADALQNNDVLRLVSASDAAGRLMMNAKETERAASFGSKIRSQEELMAFVAESTPEEKAALAKELQIEDLDSVGFEEFNQKALEYRESGKAEQFQERIRTKEQLQRLSVDNAKRMPIEIHLADGEMKRYSDGDSNISVVRNGNEYIVYDFKNGTLSQPLTKKRLDKILQRKKQIKKTQASDDKALALYEEKLQKKYDKDAPLREARARILAQMGVREETTAPNLNPDAKPQMNGVSPPNIGQNVAQNENAESNADLNTVNQSDASPYENYTNNEFSENAGKKSRGLMPLLESIADSFSGIGSSGGKTKSLRSVPSDERGAVMQPASETEADTTKNEDGQSNEKGETRSLLGVDAAKKFAESINAYRNAKNIAQEKIADFDKMDDSKKEKTVAVLKNAVKKGISAEDATMYARVSARSGLDIVFDKEACLHKVNGEEVYAAGFYDPENNRIVINPDAKKKHASLLIHELSHAIRSYVGKDNKIHYISDKNAKISDELWEKVKKHYSDQNVDVTRMELMLDEASAYYAEEILGTDAAVDLLLGKKKTLKEKILSFFKGAARDYAGDAALSKEARKLLRSFKKMFDAFTARNYGRNAEEGIAGNKTDDRRYSFSSIAFSFHGVDNMTAAEFESKDYKKTEGYKAYVEECINNMKQTQKGFDEKAARKQIENSIDGIVSVAVAMKKAGYDIADTAEQRSAKDTKNRLLFSSLEPNSDYFTSSDISTICDKRKNFAEIYDDIVRAEEAKGVPKGKRFFDNVDNYFYIHKVLADKGLTQPCRQCYVESMRKNLAPMANAFLTLVQEADGNNTKNHQLYNQSGKDKGKIKANNADTREAVRKILDGYGFSPESLTVEMLTTEDGLAEMKITMPELYERFNSFYGQSKPKMPKGATPFRFGELTALLTDNHGKIKESLVKKINSTGGFRLQSYSDFQIQNYADVLQVIFEAGTLGLHGHAYTKVPAFIDATANTNLKRNMSIFMYNDNGQWKIDRNDSFPYTLEQIYELEKDDESGNTGIIAVVQNEDMASWVMANDNVGYFIPFHKSGIKMGVVRDTIVKDGGREIKGYKDIKDHTRQQTEVWAKTSGENKANTKVSKPINIYDFWDFNNAEKLSQKELIKKNLKKYIDECEKHGYLPKFREYVMGNDKVLKNVLKYAKELGTVSESATVSDISFKYKSYTIPYGYYKCLGDFSMFKPDGTASPIRPLSLENYDFAKAVKLFSDAESVRRNEILQQFSNGTEREYYRNSTMTAEDLQKVVDTKRTEVVKEIVDQEYKKLTKKDAVKPDSAEKVNTSEKNSSDSGRRYSMDEEPNTESPTLDNVGKTRFKESKVPLKTRAKVGFVTRKDKAYIELVDELWGVEKYLKKFGGMKDAESFVQQVRASETMAQTMIGVAQYDVISGNGERLGDGLTKIFKPFHDRRTTKYFNDYLLHYLNVDRMSLNERSLAQQKALEEKLNEAEKRYRAAQKDVLAGKSDKIPQKIINEREAAKVALENFKVLENKPVFGKNEKRDHDITAEESKKIIAEYERKHPDFKAAAEKVWLYSKNLQRLRVESGLLSQNQAKIMEQYYPHYVPAFRDVTKAIGTSVVKNASQLAVNSTVKKAYGGSPDVYDVEESIAVQTRQTVKAMQMNRMANAVFDASQKSGDTMYVLSEEAKDQGNVLTEDDARDIDLIPKNNQIVFFKDGKRMTMDVTKEIFDGFNGVVNGSVPDMFLARAGATIVKGFKSLVTSLSPAFSVRNVIRDLQDAIINTKHPALFSANLIPALTSMVKNDADWQLYLAHGGYASTVFDGKGFQNDVGSRGFESLKSLTGIDAEGFKKLGNALQDVLISVSNANAFVEQFTRFTEFKASLKAGDSIQTAINNSADVTTNFARHGKTVKVLNATFIPFLNASVQGFDKFLRVIAGPAKEKSLAALAILFAKIFAIGIAPMVINMVMNGDDEDYENLSNEIKENYFLIKVGDDFLKIPRGRAASIFGGIANRIKNVSDGEDFDLPGYLGNIKEQLTPIDSFSSHIFTPVMDAFKNKTWYGGEIEGRHFDSVRPSQRYDESTSSIAIWLGDKFNVSPKKIHYVMDQYSGVIGDFLLPVTTKKAEKDYLSANFLLDPRTNNKLSSEFYEIYDEAQYATKEGNITAYYQLKHLNSVKDSVSELYDQINKIQASDMKDSEKLQEVRVLRVMINNLYKTAKVDYAAYTQAVEATNGMFDDSTETGRRLRHTAITQMMYGSEKALEEYNASVYEKSKLYNAAGLSYDTFYEFYFSTKDITPDVDRQGNEIAGSKRKKTIQAINSLGTSAQEKLLMICASGYAVKDGDIRGYSADRAKQTLYRYIKAMNVSEEERIKLAEACGFKVKNGRILIN